MPAWQPLPVACRHLPCQALPNSWALARTPCSRAAALLLVTMADSCPLPVSPLHINTLPPWKDPIQLYASNRSAAHSNGCVTQQGPRPGQCLSGLYTPGLLSCQSCLAPPDVCCAALRPWHRRLPRAATTTSVSLITSAAPHGRRWRRADAGAAIQTRCSRGITSCCCHGLRRPVDTRNEGRRGEDAQRSAGVTGTGKVGVPAAGAVRPDASVLDGSTHQGGGDGGVYAYGHTVAVRGCAVPQGGRAHWHLGGDG